MREKNKTITAPLWLKDFCVVMGIVTRFHHWAIDYDARALIQAQEDHRKESVRGMLVQSRARQIEKNLGTKEITDV